MKKNNRQPLDELQLERVVEMALEERNPFDAIKIEFNLSENQVVEILKKRISKERFETWRKLNSGKKPKLPKPSFDDDLDDEIGGKYYIPKGKI